MPLIGTAGHVDHGKSALVAALTGRDPDRWAEEKRRGLTIDLGFAWTTLDPGIEVSFVDVPGHERYLKNMLAGIEAIDVALFVVAADEGWMPQSEEHLAVLDLLAIHTGVVALTKIDLVDGEMADLVGADIADRLAGTSLHTALIVPVSSTTGEGIDQLRATLASLVAGIDHPGERPRLWVDRAFSVTGAGTVVTGSLTEGPIDVGDTLELFPGGKKARVRGMQSHETDLERAGPGRRLALNLSGVDRADLPRGTMLGRPGQWLATRRFSAHLKLARYVDEMSTRGAFHIHVGSGAHQAAIKRLEGGRALIETPTPLPLRSGDRFIIRETGRRQVVAGGVVVDPAPGSAARAMASAKGIHPEAGSNAVAAALLEERGMDSLMRLAAQTGGGRPADAFVVGDIAVTRTKFDELMASAVDEVARHHTEHPLRPGMSLATLATTLDIPAELAESLIERNDRLLRVGPDVASAGHRLELGTEGRERWEAAEAILEESLLVPTVGELGLDQELVHLLVRTGELVRVSDDLVFLPEQIAQITLMLGELAAPFTVADFRDHTGLTRKYAVPLLEWADREGLTIRQGDHRRLR
ncbi:MAG: selenocysteine-specific translation elongation factor [Acidimicrobiia bacterium]